MIVLRHLLQLAIIWMRFSYVILYVYLPFFCFNFLVLIFFGLCSYILLTDLFRARLLKVLSPSQFVVEG